MRAISLVVIGAIAAATGDMPPAAERLYIASFTVAAEVDEAYQAHEISRQATERFRLADVRNTPDPTAQIVGRIEGVFKLRRSDNSLGLFLEFQPAEQSGPLE